MKFNSQHEVQRILISVYATILEQSESVAILLKARKTAGTDAILRSLLEAFVDLLALMKDESYLQNMNASYHKEWKKLIEEGIAGDNEFLAGFEDSDGISEKLEQHKAALRDLKQAGFTPLKHFQRFEMAGMAKEYAAVYNDLCCEGHNNIRALINRHMEVHDETLELVMYKHADTEGTLDSVAGIMLNSTLAMHHRFEGGNPNGFAELEARLAFLRKERDG